MTLIDDTNFGNANHVQPNSNYSEESRHIKENKHEIKSCRRGKSLKFETDKIRRLRQTQQSINVKDEILTQVTKCRINPLTVDKSISKWKKLTSKSFNNNNSSVEYSTERTRAIKVSRLCVYRCSACSRCFKVRARLLIHCRTEHGICIKNALKLLVRQLLTKAKLFSLRRKKETLAIISNNPQSRQTTRKMVKRLFHRSNRNGDCKSAAKLSKLKDKLNKSNCLDSVQAEQLTCNKCGWCGESFGKRSELVAHRKNVHSRTPSKVIHQPFSCAKQKCVSSKRQVQRDWSCLEKTCIGVSFKTKDKLRRHMAEAHPTVLYSCPHCRFKTQVEPILKRHLIHRHKEQHVCALCAKAYHKPFLLRFHMFSHHKIPDPLLNVYHCDHEGCDYACPSRNSMNLHVLKHTSGNPFSCEICKKSFKREIGLQKHTKKLHLNIRPYICDKCGTAYADTADLKTHMNLHAEQKPFKCELCAYSSYTKASLRSHKFSRHQVTDAETPIMQCDMCSFSTHKRCHFRDHIKVHQNIRDIPCAFCAKLFITKKALNQHIIKLHPKKLSSQTDTLVHGPILNKAYLVAHESVLDQTYLITHQGNSLQQLNATEQKLNQDQRFDRQQLAFDNEKVLQNSDVLQQLHRRDRRRISHQFDEPTRRLKSDDTNELTTQESVQFQNLLSLDNFQQMDHVVNTALASFGFQLPLETGYQCF